METARGLGAIASAGPDRLITNHPGLDGFGLDAVSENGRGGRFLVGRDAAERAAGHGRRRRRRIALRALAGAYLNRDPWVGGVNILARGSELWADGVGRFINRGGWWSAEKDPLGVERARFDGMLNGRTQRLNVSGEDLC